MQVLKFTGNFSSFCSAFKEKNRCWPTDIKQIKKTLANRESILLFTFVFSTKINIEISLQNKNSYFSYLYG
jgi:hypothetical protein